MDVTEEIGGAHPYEYHGLMASTWDLFRGDTSGWEDRSTYLDLIRRHGQPVLDVGYGTGRLLLDYMAQGVDIDGVDLSPEMLALCRDRAGHMGLAPVVHQSAMALTGEKFRPEDGAVVHRWSRARYDPPARLEHSRDRYRVVQEGILLTEEEHQRSPATRWYSLDEARDRFRRARFEEPAAHQAFGQIPAQSGDRIFTLVGSRSMRTNAG